MIEVVLVYVKYDFKKSVLNGTLPIEKIVEVKKENYPDRTMLGMWEHEKEIGFRTHLQAKVRNTYQRVDIALKMTEEEANDIRTVCFTTDKKGMNLTNIFEKYHAYSNIVYYVPQALWEEDWKRNKKRKDIPNHYTSCGRCFLWIHFKNYGKQFMEFQSVSDALEEELYQKALEFIQVPKENMESRVPHPL